MERFWSYLESKDNRERLTFLGGGIAAVVMAVWGAFTYLMPSKGNGVNLTATSGGIAINGSVSNSKVTTTNPAAD